MQLLMILAIFVPMIVGAALPFIKINEKETKLKIVGATIAFDVLLVLILILTGGKTFTLFKMSDILCVKLEIDNVSKLFMFIDALGFSCAGFFAFKYLENEEKEGSFKEEMFYAFFLLTLGSLVGMAMSKNLIAMYFFFEMITLMSMPLVLFEKTKESINAALKSLFYSIAGAFLALFLIFVLAKYTTTLDFVKGGSLNMALVKGHEKLILGALFVGIIGFGAKAGMYPLHGWLPTAHPVAPAPASAVLSGVITKAGVLAILRIIYFVSGTSIIAGTWVQVGWLILSLITVFMGSMMAYREKVLKKRLAYSSVSQISYVLFGLFLLNEIGLKGALMQIVFHATVKVCLFLFAGSIIFNTSKHNVDELTGYGKVMPITFMCFTLASLSLIGIPPFAGFVSKWYLASGALNSPLSAFNYLGPTVLLISALLTAGYLLPITIKGFFPGKDFKDKLKFNDGDKLMYIPLIILASLSLIMGIFAGNLEPLFDAIVKVIL